MGGTPLTVAPYEPDEPDEEDRYPALTKMERYETPEGDINVPVAVEATSFSGSKSGAEVDENYLAPLGLTRDDVMLVDMMPY